MSRARRLSVVLAGPRCGPRCRVEDRSKKPRPWMWSMWRWVRSRLTRRMPGRERHAAAPDARAGVEDQDGALRPASHLDARRVAPVARRVRARRGQRAADAHSVTLTSSSSPRGWRGRRGSGRRDRSAETRSTSTWRRNPVEAAEPHLAVRRPALGDGDRQRQRLGGETLPVLVGRREGGRPTRPRASRPSPRSGARGPSRRARCRR